MTTAIRETVSQAMQSNGLRGYEDRAAPVVSALEAREADIAESLVEFATAQGLSKDRATAAVRDAGLTVRVQANGAVSDEEHEVVDVVRDGLSDLLAKIDSIVDRRN